MFQGSERGWEILGKGSQGWIIAVPLPAMKVTDGGSGQLLPLLIGPIAVTSATVNFVVPRGVVCFFLFPSPWRVWGFSFLIDGSRAIHSLVHAISPPHTPPPQHTVCVVKLITTSRTRN